MKLISLSMVFLLVSCLATILPAQEKICIDGQCQLVHSAPGTIVLDPLREELTLVDQEPRATANGIEGDRFDQVIRATVRVTVSGVCGSGTVVGRTSEGNAIVLTNAHVAGTQRGRTVNVERWNSNGSSERGTGTIIASGYGRGTSVDFALLKCNGTFAKDVDPIPLADRYPSDESSVTTFGCPRCEWPSLQVLRLNRKEGQILSWKPEAIGGRSGSSLIDYTDGGPRVVGLLTWAGGGEGLGQSTPFLLSAMRGKLPTTLEGLPAGTREVSCQLNDEQLIAQVPSTIQGEPQRWPVGLLANAQVQDDVIDSIIDRPN
ncbi:MAG: trypsin-like peptidase domain-containing protein, partial [Planctomycetes bacterium]|nr:trypsin-like peptidase domain-containing protein [Planctomycetota bacterium]